MKKIIFVLITLCLFAFPGSAWEQTFENHPNDEDISDFAGGTLTIVSNSNTRQFSTGGSTSYATLTIDKPFDGYIAYTWYSSASQWPDVGLALYNSSNVLLFEDKSMANAPSWTGYHRMEFIENGAGTGITCYVDGVEKDSTAYITSGAPVKIVLYINNENSQTYIDDISNEYGLIGCDNEILETDTNQYFTTGYPFPDMAYMYANLYSPSGVIISSKNITNYGVNAFSKDLIKNGGTYTIRLFQHDNLSNNNYFFASRTFIYNAPSDFSITLDKEQYSPSDQMQIFTYMPEYETGHKVTINYKTTSGYTSYTYDVTSADYTKNWVIPATAQGGSFFAYFRDPSNNVIAYDSFEITAPLGTTSLTLDKSTYENNDTVKISYKYLPEDSDITLVLRSGSTNIYTESWRDLSGSGVISFNIGGRAADSIYVKAVNSNNILKEITAKILSGNGFISGKIYDSSTNTPISGATIYIGGSETTSNALGYYEMTTLMGTQPVSITKDGYNQYTGNVQIYSLSTSRNFYLVKTISSGSNTLYGTISDYYTGAALNSTYIQIQNGSTVYSMLTHSKTGNYLFDQEGLSGSWDVTVTKTGYDTHTQTVTIDGDTYLSIKLVPIGGSSSIPDDDEEGSNSDSGSSSTERPGRQAARDSMAELEGIVPGLISFVVLVVFIQLMKEM